MSQLVDRAMMESVFPPGKVVRVPEDRLPVGLHESARSFLTEVGLPDLRNSWYLADAALVEDEAPDGLRLCGKLRYFSQFESLPDGAENWIVLGSVPYDGLALDPVTGNIYSLPDGESKIYMLNQSLDSFGYFLYLLETERPNYDFSVSDEIPDSEGVAAYLRERMIRADPVSFDGVEPAWSETFDWESEDAPHLPTWDRVLHNVHESLY